MSILAATETPGVPVTGDVNPARLSNQLDFTVWSQDGEQIGEVDDMVLNLDNTQIAYVVVGTGGSLDLGERLMPVPLSAIQWDAANGAFVINANPATFRDAPFFTDGQYPDSTTSGWNSEFDAFWQNVVTP